VKPVRDPDLRALRDRLARRLGRDVALLGALPLAYDLWDVSRHAPALWPSALLLSLTLLAAGVAAAAPLRPAVRIGLVLGAIAFICMISSISVGLMPATAGGAAIVCLFAAFLTGPRFARTLTCACMAWIVAVGAFHRVAPGFFARAASLADVSRPANWTRTFFTLVALTVVSIPALIEHVRALSTSTGLSRELLAAALDEERRREEATAAYARAKAERREAAHLEVIEFVGEGFARTCGNLLQAIRTEVELMALASTRPNGEIRRPAAGDSSSFVRQGVSEMVGAVKGAAAVLRRLSPGEQGNGEWVGPVDLREVALSMKRQLGKLEGIHIAIRVDSAVVAQADGSALDGVILNLALNARDAMPSGGSLTLAARHATPDERRQTGCAVALDVSDTGSGMSEATLSHAFEPFFTTKGATGTGLGLNAARRVLEAMGGRIRVRSTLGKGTTFTLLFPAAGQTVARPEPLVPRPARARGVPILIADDDPAIRRSWRAALQSHQFSVLEAATIDEALLLARTNQLALAWIDAAMPGRPARDLVDELRRTRPDVHLVVCSGLTEDELKRRDLRSGDLELIAKPCPLEVFLDRVSLAAADYRAGFARDDG